ncbi:ADP-ribosylglycohydrolase family protein [Microbulbifer sp. OS29]|uniref:ADP-ribosylglycohydrolase family protein n=1 Tax=Microbulbifer okhotskensis TaxID=2926617 RepID=A0A9X2EUT3_9GAMM|nr:ADP-ribosylglycohydrolase family protein [Microbulbifer okhotskensis]MCO1336293.1 ADP-ribosylglycohydrolase family protein [Microbulbifer okhotskensis]
MLLEIAIGDAYGAGFEFCNREIITHNNHVNGYIAHPLGIKAGCYTDDTQMSLAIAELILEKPAPLASDFAQAFVHTYKRDPRLGYASGFQQLLDSCHSGKDLTQKIRPHSKRNGAAMRSVPLGVIPDINQLLQLTKCQAGITHNTKEGILSAQAVALMAHGLIHQKAAIKDLVPFIESTIEIKMVSNWSGKVNCDALETLAAVNTALQKNRSFTELLHACVNFGGDTDSVAAIACGLASLSREYDSEIPSSLITGLESSPYGYQYLLEIDRKISNIF